MQIPIAWEKFKRISAVMRSDPAKFGADVESAAALDVLLTSLDTCLIPGRTFRAALDQVFGPFPYDGAGEATRALLCARAVENVEWLLSTIGTELETFESSQLVGQYAIYALTRALDTRSPVDRKVFDRLWSITARLPLVVLYTKYLWSPDTFLVEFAAFAGLDIRKLAPKDPRVVREAAAGELVEAIGPFAGQLYVRFAAWSIKAHAAFALEPLISSTRSDPADLLRERANLLTQAVCMNYQLSRFVSLFLNFHMSLKKGACLWAGAGGVVGGGF